MDQHQIIMKKNEENEEQESHLSLIELTSLVKLFEMIFLRYRPIKVYVS